MRLQIVDLVPVEREVHEFVGLGVLIAPVPDVLDLPDPDGLLIDPSHEIAGGTWKIVSGLPHAFSRSRRQPWAYGRGGPA